MDYTNNNTSSNTGSYGSELIGAVVLPRGLKPTNPLKLFEGSRNNGLELTKRIVEKHKERVARTDRMKATEFRKSLYLAAKPNATATGVVDDGLQQQVRELLVAKSNKSRAVQPLQLNNNSSNQQSDNTNRGMLT